MKVSKWRIFSWYCPNCGLLDSSCADAKGKVKVRCRRCGADMVLKIRGRRHTSIEVYAPEM